MLKTCFLLLALGILSSNCENNKCHETEEFMDSNTSTTSCGYSDSNDDLLTESGKSTPNVTTTQIQLFTTPFPLVAEMFLANPSLKAVKEYIKNEQFVVEYLAGFRNEFQRNVVETQLTYCPFTSKCGISMNMEIVYSEMKSCCQACECSNCDSQSDCCPSMMPESWFQVPDATSMVDFVKHNSLTLLSPGSDSLQRSCISKHLKVLPPNTDESFLAIAKCPPQTDYILHWNCTRPYSPDLWFDDFLPVFSNKTLQIYRNKYCGVCNNIPLEQMVFYRPKFTCSNSSVFENMATVNNIIPTVFEMESCDISFVNADERIPPKDCKYEIEICNATGIWKVYNARLEYACHLYKDKYEDDRTDLVFRNVFCAFCNGIEPKTSMCSAFGNVVTEIFAFSGLLSLNFEQKFATSSMTLSSHVSAHQCTEQQIFDKLLGICRDIVCPEMQVVSDRKCTKIFESLSGTLRYTVYLRLVTSTETFLADVFGVNSDWVDKIERFLYSLHPELRMCDIQFSFTTNMKFTRSIRENIRYAKLRHIDVRIRLGKQNRQSPWDISDSLIQLHGTSFSFSTSSNSTIDFVLILMHHSAQHFDVIKQLYSNLQGLAMFGEEDETWKMSTLAQYAWTDPAGYTFIPYSYKSFFNMFSCNSEKDVDILAFSSCPKVNISKEDIRWELIDGYLIIDGSQIDTREYYYIENDNVMLCVDTFLKLADRLHPERAVTPEILVSLISSSLTVVCIFITFVIFVIFSELRRSVPGKNNMALALSLFVAHILFLVGSQAPFEQYSVACQLTGFLIHFCWLTAVFWMNVCTFHMFRVLTRTKSINPNFSGWKRFLVYNLYTCLMSVTFVVANVVYSYIVSGDIGYGGKFCYITSQERIVFTFVVPTTLVALANILLFLVVIVKLRGTPSVLKHVQNDRNNLIILVKLSSITGATWLFGGIYLLTNVQALSFIFIILNACQGIFIMFAFVMNRRVWMLLKDLRKGRAKLNYRPSSATPRSTSLTKV